MTNFIKKFIYDDGSPEEPVKPVTPEVPIPVVDKRTHTVVTAPVGAPKPLYRPHVPAPTTVIPVEQPVAEPEGSFEDKIWGFTVPEGCTLDKFLKAADKLKVRIPDEATRLDAAASVMETASGITKADIVSDLDKKIEDLQNDRPKYETQLEQLRTTMVGEEENKLNSMTEELQQIETQLQELEARRTELKKAKVDTEVAVETGVKAYQSKVADFNSAYEKIFSKLNALKVKING